MMRLWWPGCLANRQPSVTPRLQAASCTSAAWAPAAASKAGPEQPWTQRVCPEPLCLLTTGISMSHTIQEKGTRTSWLGQEKLSHQSLNTYKKTAHYIDILSLGTPLLGECSEPITQPLKLERQGRGQLQTLPESPPPSFLFQHSVYNAVPEMRGHNGIGDMAWPWEPALPREKERQGAAVWSSG